MSAVSLQSTWFSLYFLQTSLVFIDCHFSVSCADFQHAFCSLACQFCVVCFGFLGFCCFSVCRFPKFLWIVSVSIVVSDFPHRQFSSKISGRQVCRSNFYAVHKPASGSENCRDFCQVLEAPPEYRKKKSFVHIVNNVAVVVSACAAS